jgi:ADP-dependent NAD(P)H-hydrate dehydratase / NAD(P)H-hydrate epimerase
MKYLTKADIRKLKLPKRDDNAHKGDHGKVLLVGGSPDYVGALALAGIAALRSGVDNVTVASPGKVSWALNTLSPDLITKKYDCLYFDKKHVNSVVKFAKDFDCVLVGNGIGRRSHKFCTELVQKLSEKKKPMVVDADAVKAISLKDVKGSILTPHKREFQTLLENSRIRRLQLKKHIRDNVLVVKGSVDAIYHENKVKYNKTGNPAMTIGGTGDVLAGLSAGFFAQTKDPVHSAMAAAYISGLAGDIVRGEVGAGLIASDMLKKIAFAIDETFTVVKKRNKR